MLLGMDFCKKKAITELAEKDLHGRIEKNPKNGTYESYVLV